MAPFYAKSNARNKIFFLVKKKGRKRHLHDKWCYLKHKILANSENNISIESAKIPRRVSIERTSSIAIYKFIKFLLKQWINLAISSTDRLPSTVVWCVLLRIFRALRREKKLPSKKKSKAEWGKRTCLL